MSVLEKIPTPGDLLRKYGLAPRKEWGQNFLHDVGVHRSIVEQIDIENKTVIEIGAGLGTLTSHLLTAGFDVHAIERDRDLCDVLRKELGHVESFKLNEADAVKFDYDIFPNERPTIVGNLPYHLTAPLLFRLFEFHQTTGPWITMIQKEVGQRLCAEPGSKVYGGITATLSRLRQISMVRGVPPGAFLPPPRVDSVVIRLDPRPEPLGEVEDAQGYQQLIRYAFQGRRKTLLNSLSKLAPKEVVRQWFEKTGISSGERPEQLGPQEFAALQRAREEVNAG